MFIDPQRQASRWLEARHGDLCQLNASAHKLMKDAVDALQLEKPVLIKLSGNSIDGRLAPLLQPKFVPVSSGSMPDTRFRLVVDDELTVELRRPKIVLYLSTAQVNPRFLPEVYSLSTVINFTVNNDSMEEQLLNTIVKAELPELQGQLHALQCEVAQNQLLEQQQQDKLL